MKGVALILVLAVPCLGQQQPPIRDLNLLVGKQVIAQRMPLCQPGTYTTVLAYAGKQGKVISLKPSSITHLSESTMSRLAPDARALMEDAQKAATILVQFEDGTKLDTCAPIGPRKLLDYFEVAPGEGLGSVGQSGNPGVPSPTVVDSSVSPSTPLTQTGSVLADDEVVSAIGGKGKDHWVSIQDMGLMAAQGNQVPTITLYMPEAVLAVQAASAKKQFTKYSPSEEEKRRSLMVVAEGYAGKTITEGCTSITRVVLLSDPSGTLVEEAYLSEPLAETWRNNFGARNECQALRAKFSLDEVQRVKAAAPNGEFLVAVFSGNIKTKVYKIKRKHQSKLGLE